MLWQTGFSQYENKYCVLDQWILEYNAKSPLVKTICQGLDGARSTLYSQ